MNSSRKPNINALTAAFEGGRFEDAAALARDMTQREPANGIAWNALGSALARLGRVEEAAVAFVRAAEKNPNDSDLFSNLGLALFRLGRLQESEASYRRALAINPMDPTTHDSLGLVLQGLRRLEEAKHCHETALRIAPTFAQAHNNLGVALRLGEQLERAEAQFRRAIEIQPAYAEAFNNLGGVLHEMQRSWDAEPCFRRALQIQPNYVSALSNLGATLSSLSQWDEAQSCLRRALEINPDDLDIRSGLIFYGSYANQDERRYREQILEYGRIVAKKVGARFSSWKCPMKAPRLRVGLVSGDLHGHPVGYFLERVLANIDPTRIELFAYPTNNKGDELGARLRNLVAAWRPVTGMSDAQAAQRIHDDGIHILLDLSGHTKGNRLPLFAWKAAPVQASWLGYFASSGVAEIDYFIADRFSLPEGTKQPFTEKIQYLPETRLCFTPPNLELSVGGLPATDQGYVTFCCFNNLSKMNDTVVVTWSRILDEIPDARLLLKAHQLADAHQRQRVIERFSSCGIRADRLVLEGPSTREAYLASYHRADIALDPFPYSGATTTVESLWMGVPVVTLAGDRLISRQGVSLLMNAGLEDWVATGVDEYVKKAVANARNVGALATLRKELRGKVLNSPILDGPRFARHLTDAFFSMWTTYDSSASIASTAQ